MKHFAPAPPEAHEGVTGFDVNHNLEGRWIGLCRVKAQVAG